MATTEVAEALGLVDFIQEVNVYGVEVPGRPNRQVRARVLSESVKAEIVLAHVQGRRAEPGWPL